VGSRLITEQVSKFKGILLGERPQAPNTG